MPPAMVQSPKKEMTPCLITRHIIPPLDETMRGIFCTYAATAWWFFAAGEAPITPDTSIDHTTSIDTRKETHMTIDLKTLKAIEKTEQGCNQRHQIPRAWKPTAAMSPQT